MLKSLEGHNTVFILIAEDPLGNMIICQEYKEDQYEIAMKAFNLLHAPKVCLYRQENDLKLIGCKPTI